MKKETHDGHMTGDNEEVSESRGTSACGCHHEGFLIVQRRAGGVWGRRPCMPSLVPARFSFRLRGMFSLTHGTEFLATSSFFIHFLPFEKHMPFLPDLHILGMNWIEYSMLCIYSSLLPIPRSILGRRNNSQRAQY